MLASPNYDISYANGVLTVRAATNPAYTGAVSGAFQLAGLGRGGLGGTGGGFGGGTGGLGGGTGGLGGTTAWAACWRLAAAVSTSAGSGRQDRNNNQGEVYSQGIRAAGGGRK